MLLCQTSVTLQLYNTMRHYTSLDRLLEVIDQAIKVLTVQSTAQREIPSTETNCDDELIAADKRDSARLMRVNHAGEISAQGLYHGQALTARSNTTVKQLKQASHEEADHLAWCEKRIRELGGRTSLLTPLWYVGSMSIGAVVGLFGDRYSLGFVKETEDQVVQHLKSHCRRISSKDKRTLAIIRQIQADEAEHAQQAQEAGGSNLPAPVRQAMRMAAKVMTSIAHYL